MTSIYIYFCIISARAVAAVGRIAAVGVQRAAADEVERVALRQLNAGTGARLSAGIGSRAGKRCAGGDVEIHRALDGEAAAADGRIGETEVARGVIVRHGICAAQRPPRRGASAQRRPVRLSGLRLPGDHIPVVGHLGDGGVKVESEAGADVVAVFLRVVAVPTAAAEVVAPRVAGIILRRRPVVVGRAPLHISASNAAEAIVQGVGAAGSGNHQVPLVLGGQLPRAAGDGRGLGRAGAYGRTPGHPVALVGQRERQALVVLRVEVGNHGHSRFAVSLCRRYIVIDTAVGANHATDVTGRAVDTVVGPRALRDCRQQQGEDH